MESFSEPSPAVLIPTDGRKLRVAIASESFLPTTNGVTTSVCRVLDYLRANGHEAIIITPSAGGKLSYKGFRVFELPAVAYRQFPVGLPSLQIQRILANFAPDVLHAASPFIIGGQAIDAADRLGIPSVAIFQTDIAGYAARNKLGAATRIAWRIVRRIHSRATLTLVPSSASMKDLQAVGIDRLERWGRGVDLERYHPNNRLRPEVAALRERIAPNGELIVGYIGRLAPEKQVERFAAFRGIPNVRFVMVGDGPSVPSVRRALSGMPVTWLGRLGGDELTTAWAALDVFVHTGTEETFGQTVQEAQASGVPVIAPRSGGPIDLIREGVNGLLFEPGDDAQLRGLVERLAADDSLRLRIGEAGRRSVLGKSWAAVCGVLVDYYRTAIGDRAPAEVAPPKRARPAKVS